VPLIAHWREREHAGLAAGARTTHSRGDIAMAMG